MERDSRLCGSSISVKSGVWRVRRIGVADLCFAITETLVDHAFLVQPGARLHDSRQPWQSWQRRVCKLQNKKALIGSESRLLRQTRLQWHDSMPLLI
jgi:hypothetical protein